jgi:DNA-binding PadR family transcriptional regulator
MMTIMALTKVLGGGMDENELLILGLLCEQSQHGYQINEFIEQNLSRLTTMKRPTAYATLDRLHRQGFVSVRTEQPSKRAPRKVYAISARAPTSACSSSTTCRGRRSTAH